MKDKISHVHSRAVPYAATPRRALHAENGTFTGRPVRQANNPACRLPQYLPAVGNQFEDCNEYIGTVECGPAFRSFYVQSSGSTCAKVACDNNLPNIRKATPSPFTLGGQTYDRLNDTRCFIAIPPDEFTFPFVDGLSSARSGRYRNIPGTVSYNVAQPLNTESIYPGPGVIHDVDSSRCYAGLRDKTVAREIQQEIGITAAIGATAIASCVQASSGAAAAASAQAATITGLAVTLGLAGSAVVIGGAAYAGYKLVQHYKLKNEVTPDVTPDVTVDNTYRNYEDIDLNRIDTNEHIIVAPKLVFDSPFGPPLKNTSQL